MSPTITLLTSDTPSVSVIVPRDVLVSNSKVFADLLSLPTSAQESSVDASLSVSESQHELGHFLDLLEGKEGGERLEEVWETLARLGDKYDSELVRKEIKARIWEVEAKRGNPLHTFALATQLGNKELLQHTALRAILHPAWEQATIPQQLEDRLAIRKLESPKPCRNYD
ncbi:hypothetical protein JCM8547_005125 [Rhodosporidiobolus lusitaniae]